ncbi:IS3 family transposase [Rhodococcus sp. NPDC056516]
MNEKVSSRAWADLRAAGWVINKKKVQRLWREEGVRVKVPQDP